MSSDLLAFKNHSKIMAPDAKGEEGVKLNLGGRTHKIPGFLTVDLEPGSDVECDVSKLDFGDASVDEIYASHILEHFGHECTVSVLKEWHRVLKKGARAYVAVPDFDAVVKIYLKSGLTPFLNNFLWGDQGYELAFHYSGFTFPTLAAALVKAGFEDVKRMLNFPYRLPDCSTLRDTHFKMPISLNVVAVK